MDHDTVVTLLDGEPQESRPGERIGLIAMRARALVLGKYRPTPVEAVAKAMIELAKKPTTGSHVLEANAIRRIAG